ncbi:unnamed protein product [Rotaria socialis]
MNLMIGVKSLFCFRFLDHIGSDICGTSTSNSTTQSVLYREGGEFAEGTNKIRLVCNGRPCAQCFQCRDWHFEGDEETWTWISNYRKWNDEDEDRWYSDAVYECFTKRDDAMCKFSGYNNDAYSSNGYLLHGGYGVSHGNVYDHSCVCEKH